MDSAAQPADTMADETLRPSGPPDADDEGVRVQPATRLSAQPADDLTERPHRRPVRHRTGPVLAVISGGGALGAVARHALAVAMPHPRTGFPTATLVTNVAGCLLMGVLMVLITEVWSAHRLLRPFLGIGVLGGFTTFSTYTVEVQQLVAAGAARTALLYLAATPLTALIAVYAGASTTRLATRARAHCRPDRKETLSEDLVIDPVEVIRYVGRPDGPTR